MKKTIANKHILVISQYFYPESFRINDICQEWIKRGHRVTVLTGIPNYPKGDFYEGYDYTHKRNEVWNDIEIIRLPIKPRRTGAFHLSLNYLSFVFEGWKWIKKTNLDADSVFIYEVSPMTQALVGVWFAKKFNLKCVLYVTDLWPENVAIVLKTHNKLFLGLIGKMVDYIYKNSNHILTSSQSFIEKIKKRGVDENKLFYWPQYAEDFYKKADRKSELEIPDDGIVNFTFAGNIGTAQGLDVLVRTAEILKDQKIRVRFNIIGNGRYEIELKNHIERADVTEFFNFISRKPAEDIPNYFAWSDAVLITLSKSEVYSMTIPAKTQSCLACGMPVLVSADGEVKNIIKDAECGLCSESGNANDLAENVIKFINFTKEERAQFSKNALKYYQDHFDKNYLMNRVEELI